MAQRWRVSRQSPPKPSPPLDGDSLEQLALNYVGRYATTRAKLRVYLARKLRERGWHDETAPPVATLAEKFAGLGYIDDAGFARSRAASLGRRGYGARRVALALHAAGIEEQDAVDAREIAEAGAWEAAQVFARKRRIGPFADSPLDPLRRRKALAAMIRAGHSYEIARKFVESEVGISPDHGD